MLQTHTRNTYCLLFFTATVVTRTLLNVTLYVLTLPVLYGLI